MGYSRDYEWKLLCKLREYDVSDTDILEGVLGFLSSDVSCAALESIAEDDDLLYDFDE